MKRWLAIIGISLLLILFIYPSAFIYPKDTLPGNNDTRLIAYIIGQVQKNILEHRPLHYGTFFAPDENTLAYSDLFLASALTTLPFRLFFSSPILIFNLALVLGFLLTLTTSYLLFEYLFKDILLTLLAVILYTFSGFHLSYFPHLQVFSLWPMFLSLYFFLRFQTENRRLFLTLFFITVTVQIAESVFPAYLIFFAITTIVIARFVFEPKQSIPSGSPRRVLLAMTKHSLPFLPLWIYLLFPYLQLHLSFPEATRPIRDAANFSLGLDQLFTFYHSWTLICILFLSTLLTKIQNATEVPAKSRAERIRTRTRGTEVEHSFLRSSKRFVFEPWHLVFCFSIVMSLGPVLKIFGSNLRIFGFPLPLPYALFYYLFPGFNGFRTPSRFIVLALLAAVIIIGYQLKPAFKKLQPRTKFIFILLTISLLFVEADLPLKGYPVNVNMHPVYQEVKALPANAVILELPIKLWNMPDHEIESVRSIFSLFHNHRRFGGFSGFATNSWIDLVEKVNAYGLNDENTTRLKSLGITHVIENNRLSPL